MKKLTKTIAAAFSAAAGAFKETAFCNIAEGTHAGRVTIRAASDIPQANLVVKLAEGGIAPAGAGDMPAGVCTDCGEAGDMLDVALPGCAESSFICVCDTSANAGDALYTSAGGRVSTYAGAGSHKVGVAISSVPGGGLVEVDPQNFGSSAYKIVACGIHTWASAGKTETLQVAGMSENDIAVASIRECGGSERAVFAAALPDDGGLQLTLDQNGTANSTKINWIIARA